MPDPAFVNQQETRTQASISKEAPAVSVLIVGYNTKDLLSDCLAGLFEHTEGVNLEVLFVDCSNDGSAQMLRQHYPQVRVIENERNLGFGRGNNFLARHARGEYLLLLNPDTLIQDNAIGALYEFAQQTPEAGAWGGVTCLPDGGVDPGCRQPAPGLKSALMLLVGLGSMASPDVTSAGDDGADVPSLSGAFMMMPRALWEELGGFDETFFMYCEETDLCLRVRKSGRRVLITPNARIVHLVGSGSGQSPKRMIALTRGGMHLARKHFSVVHVWAEAAVRWLYSVSRYALGLVGQPLVGRARAKELRARHAPIITNPCSWFGGWPPQEPPGQSPNGSAMA